MVVDACLPKGFNETFVSPEDGNEYLIVPADDGADFDACDQQVCTFVISPPSALRGAFVVYLLRILEYNPHPPLSLFFSPKD